MSGNLLDRVVEMRPGERGVAILNVPNTLAIFDSHFPRFPVLPGVLLIERITEVAKRVAPQQLRRQHVINGVRFRRYVKPGDQVWITVDAVTADRDFFTCRAVAEVEGREVTTVATLTFETDTEDPA